MLRERQNKMCYVWGGSLLKVPLNRFPLFVCTTCITLSFAFHHIWDASYIHPNCLWFSLFPLFHFYSAEIYFTYTNCCLCMILLIIDFLSFYLLVSYLLIQFMHHHYCHQRMLITEKCGFLFNKSSKICRSSYYLTDVLCHLPYYTPHIVLWISVNKVTTYLFFYMYFPK